MFEAENSLREVNEKCPLHVISFLYYLTLADPHLEIRERREGGGGRRSYRPLDKGEGAGLENFFFSDLRGDLTLLKQSSTPPFWSCVSKYLNRKNL